MTCLAETHELPPGRAHTVVLPEGDYECLLYESAQERCLLVGVLDDGHTLGISMPRYERRLEAVVTHLLGLRNDGGVPVRAVRVESLPCGVTPGVGV
jgi:hypothetical protein